MPSVVEMVGSVLCKAKNSARCTLRQAEMRNSGSTTFRRIRLLVQLGALNNRVGFTTDEIPRVAPDLNSATIGTFIPKHCRVPNIYLESLGNYRYRIRAVWL